MSPGDIWRSRSGSINFEQLEVFHMAARTRSFTETAERLFLTQSAVSQRIKHLESAVGAPLFFRDSRRGVRLTPAGQRFLEFVQIVVDHLSRAQADIYELTRSPEKESLRIAGTQSSLRYITTVLLIPFQQTF